VAKFYTGQKSFLVFKHYFQILLRRMTKPPKSYLGGSVLSILRLIKATLLLSLLFVGSLVYCSEGYYYIDNSIDVLDTPRNFSSSISIEASDKKNFTIVKRVPSKDPTWWRAGIAVKIIQVQGIPVPKDLKNKIFYPSRSYFKKGASEVPTTDLVLPSDIPKLIDMKMISPTEKKKCIGCEDKSPPSLSDREAEIELKVEKRAGHQKKFLSLVKGKSNYQCNKLRNNDYDHDWKNLTKKERVELINLKTNRIFKDMKVSGFKESCKKYLGDHIQKEFKNLVEKNIRSVITQVMKNYVPNKKWKRSFRVQDLPKLINSEKDNYEELIKVKILGHYTAKQMGTKKVQELLSKITFPTAEKLLKGFKKDFRGYKSIPQKAVRNKMAKYIAESIKGFADDFSQIAKEELQENFIGDIIPKSGLAPKSIKDSKKACFAVLAKMHNNGKSSLSQESLDRFKQNYKSERKKLTPTDFNHVGPHLSPEIAMCIFRSESLQSQYSPQTFNYEFCNVNTRKTGKVPRTSSAVGLGQMVRTTFGLLWKGTSLNLGGLNYSGKSVKKIKDVKNLHAQLVDSPDAQIEGTLQYLNLLLKSRTPSKASLFKIQRKAKVKLIKIQSDIDKMQGKIKLLEEKKKLSKKDKINLKVYSKKLKRFKRQYKDRERCILTSEDIASSNKVEKTLISYDQDNASCYLKKARKCMKCFNKKVSKNPDAIYGCMGVKK
jgi:hypothetical protein